MKYENAFYIGRFQPFHNGHKKVVEYGLTIADKVTIMVGSSNCPQTIKNPFKYCDRYFMIMDSFDSIQQSRIDIVPLNDYTYNDAEWTKQVQGIICDSNTKKNAIIGFCKDESSYYLNSFPNLDQHFFTDDANHQEMIINATNIREAYFSDPDTFFGGFASLAITPASLDFMRTFVGFDEFAKLKREYGFIQDYKKAWAAAPYPPTFVTTDAIVVQSGHVLLIQRKFEPGKGLWALPGGFLEQDESLFDGCIRELRQETGLKVPEKVLKGSMTYNHVFDSPSRSERGRTITHAYLFELKDDEALPHIRGSDDAEKAKWIPFNEVIDDMAPMMYEDHYGILMHMFGRVK